MKVAIVGGGAAGMMCAATINELNPTAKVFLIEKNDILGKKVLISGGGRCNVTTGIQDLRFVLKKYPRGEKFLQSAMHNFSPDDVYRWFEDHGTPLKCEEDYRVFPTSDNGADIVQVFENIFRAHGTKILLKHAVQKIEHAKNGFTLFFKNNDEPLEVDYLVLSPGGQAYRHTGSTGDGYTFAEALGHTITPLAASLNSFITQEKWPRSLSGLSFTEATITAKNKREISFTGPFLFTHMGISGPAVFALSSLIAFEQYNPQEPLPIFIDFLPSMHFEEICKQIENFVHEYSKKSFKNVLHTYIPLSLCEVICNELHIPVEKKCAEVSKAEMHRAAEWLKRLPLHAIGRGAGDEFVTAGGVKLPEVDPRTMESKVCPRLYFAGEILDIDGFTGGFNLQASWATGFTAGRHIAQGMAE